MNTKELTRHVHEGEVLRPAGDIKITLRIDPAVMARAAAALARFGVALRNDAAKIQPWNRPDEQNVIDQD